ncbi:hypothetical protein A4X13_0g6265 [Tilletia indica]|uniref:Uncharacterized protein n=1 Tax=Tilletia indica TaxID=43049 RepID=A0A177TAN3_9BASI|nr:hypothetical protein A4X13_0g6265 [Tilletia indica]
MVWSQVVMRTGLTDGESGEGAEAGAVEVVIERGAEIIVDACGGCFGEGGSDNGTVVDDDAVPSTEVSTEVDGGEDGAAGNGKVQDGEGDADKDAEEGDLDEGGMKFGEGKGSSTLWTRRPARS